jgi:hypothetical protein
MRVTAACVRRAAAAISVAALATGSVLAVVQASPASAESSPGYCTGASQARFPAVSGITNAAGTQGGHLWWRDQAGGTCIGTVVVDVRSAAGAALAWQVIVYDDRDPGGRVIFREALPSPEPGIYQFTFGVHQVFTGLTAVCVGAVSCVTFSAPS